jgi:hypothetical protein
MTKLNNACQSDVKTSHRYTWDCRCRLINYPCAPSPPTLPKPKTDRYLAGWQAALLNVMGRAVMVNAVLDSQLIYAMCALPLPAGIISQVDQRRRSFLWSGESSMTGSQSLVAWERVCWNRDHGGLGIKDLSLMNVCLLLKLIHRLHVAEDSAWAAWARQHVSLASLEGDLCHSTLGCASDTASFTRRSPR